MGNSDLGWADIRRNKTGYVLVWEPGLERADSAHASRSEALAAYFFQLALDYLGNAIRDNTRAEKIHLGRLIEKYGVDEAGRINSPNRDAE